MRRASLALGACALVLTLAGTASAGWYRGCYPPPVVVVQPCRPCIPAPVCVQPVPVRVCPVVVQQPVCQPCPPPCPPPCGVIVRHSRHCR